jgi:hypothetical protein
VRRHLATLPHLFVTYDAMLAIAKAHANPNNGELVCYARLGTIANYTNRSRNQELENIARLVDLGLLIPKKRIGSQGSRRYTVVEHETFAAGHACPPFRYDWDTGDSVAAGPEPARLLKYRMSNQSALGADSAESTGSNQSQLGFVESNRSHYGIKAEPLVESKPALTESVSSLKSFSGENLLPVTATATATDSKATAPSDSSGLTDLTEPKAAVRGDLTTPPTETIGSHFPETGLTIEQVTDNEIDKDSVQYEHWDKLLECCAAVIQQRAAQPFNQRKTCGDIMAWGMERLRKTHNLNVPKPWVPTFKALRQSGGPCIVEIESHTAEPAWLKQIGSCLKSAAENGGIDLSRYVEPIQAELALLPERQLYERGPLERALAGYSEIPDFIDKVIARVGIPAPELIAAKEWALARTAKAGTRAG